MNISRSSGSSGDDSIGATVGLLSGVGTGVGDIFQPGGVKPHGQPVGIDVHGHKGGVGVGDTHLSYNGLYLFSYTKAKEHWIANI